MLTEFITSGYPTPSAINTGYVKVFNAHLPAVVALNEDGTPLNKSDKELVITRYSCKVAFTGADVGDSIRQITFIDVTGTQMQVTETLWQNESKGNNTIAAPSSITGFLEVNSTGTATAFNQVTQIGYIKDVADSLERLNVLTSLGDTGNWTETAFSTEYTSRWTAIQNGTGFVIGDVLTKIRTITHSTSVETTVWKKALITIGTPNNAAIKQTSAEIISSHTRKRTSPLSATEQTGNVTFSVTTPTVPNTISGWA